MPGIKGPCKFREREVARAGRAVRAAGFDIDRVDFARDGSFSVIVRQPGGERQAPKSNTFDEILNGKPAARVRP
jgi:hypothetical protein